MKTKWDNYLGPNSRANVLATIEENKSVNNEHLAHKANKWLDPETRTPKNKEEIVRSRMYDFKTVFESRARELAKFDYGTLKAQF